MGNILYFCDDCTRDYFGYGVISKCPICNSRTILSYPTTQCSQCQNRFRNDITALNVYTYTTFCGHKRIGIKYGQRAFEGFTEPQSEGLKDPQPSNQRLLRASGVKQNLQTC